MTFYLCIQIELEQVFGCLNINQNLYIYFLQSIYFLKKSNIYMGRTKLLKILKMFCTHKIAQIFFIAFYKPFSNFYSLVQSWLKICFNKIKLSFTEQYCQLKDTYQVSCQVQGLFCYYKVNVVNFSPVMKKNWLLLLDSHDLI